MKVNDKYELVLKNGTQKVNYNRQHNRIFIRESKNGTDQIKIFNLKITNQEYQTVYIRKISTYELYR